jgi:hypothetical protein
MLREICSRCKGKGIVSAGMGSEDNLKVCTSEQCPIRKGSGTLEIDEKSLSVGMASDLKLCPFNQKKCMGGTCMLWESVIKKEYDIFNQEYEYVDRGYCGAKGKWRG